MRRDGPDLRHATTIAWMTLTPVQVLQVAAVYTPFLQTVLHTVPAAILDAAAHR